MKSLYYRFLYYYYKMKIKYLFWREERKALKNGTVINMGSIRAVLVEANKKGIKLS